MTELIILMLIVAVVVVGFWYPGWRDQRIAARPFPANWQTLLNRAIPYLDKLSAQEREQLKSNIQLFLAKNAFMGVVAWPSPTRFASPLPHRPACCC